ncbi:hypothetical protein BKA80DRAFT_142638 [Phyllosticta citrichinensis]
MRNFGGEVLIGLQRVTRLQRGFSCCICGDGCRPIRWGKEVRTEDKSPATARGDDGVVVWRLAAGGYLGLPPHCTAPHRNAPRAETGRSRSKDSGFGHTARNKILNQRAENASSAKFTRVPSDSAQTQHAAPHTSSHASHRHHVLTRPPPSDPRPSQSFR